MSKQDKKFMIVSIIGVAAIFAMSISVHGWVVGIISPIIAIPIMLLFSYLLNKWIEK